MSVPMIFISSTFLEFGDERRNLQSILTKTLPIACNLAEHLACDTPDLELHLRKCIDKADIIVLLLGIRYGSTKGRISWTEKEVRYAYSCRKRILPYIKDQPPPHPIADLDQKKQEALHSFTDFIERTISPSIPRFSTLQELVALVVRDICMR